MGEGAYRAGDLADGDGGTRPRHAADVAAELVVPERQLEAERHGLGVHAVRAADHRRAAVFLGAPVDSLAKAAEQLQDEVGRLHHLERLGRVDDVRRSEAEMQPARRRPDVFGYRRREGDDVVLRRLLDLFDARDVEAGLLAKFAGGLGRHDAHSGHDVGRGQFDGQPRFVAPFFRPDAPHFGVRVSPDHARASCSASMVAGVPPPSTVRLRVPVGKSRCATRATSASVTASMATSMSSSDSPVSP